MKEILERSEYNFLKTNSDLQHVIYLVLSGSRAYGTSTDNSDYDLRGVCLEQAKYLYGLDGFEQFEDLPSDTVIYGLKKFAKVFFFTGTFRTAKNRFGTNCVGANIFNNG